ncbi:DNA-binding response regulator [Paenibacillus alginolyticus]|uniref:DNA-binding response regulator n=1 Tax=Paenibacillus alginolyticus TaxID=59839 RepID=UPI001FECB1B9|nr:DNA-binding response regulator [Paenibacillus frigoriresistens]
MNEFDKAHETFLAKHISMRVGERLKRLKRVMVMRRSCFLSRFCGVLLDNFKTCIRIYEVKDFRDGTRFLDFAFLRHSVRLAIEIDGFGPHFADISRSQFSDQLIRQNHLILDGWKIFHFSYDDVKKRPRMCEQLIQQCIGRHFGDVFNHVLELNYIEKEIIRFAHTLGRAIKPSDVQKQFQFRQRKAQETLYQKSLLEPAGEGHARVRSYRVAQHVLASWEGLGWG